VAPALGTTVQLDSSWPVSRKERSSIDSVPNGAIAPLLPFNIGPMNGQDAPRSGHSENKLRTGLFDPECQGRGRPLLIDLGIQARAFQQRRGSLRGDLLSGHNGCGG